MKKISSNTVLIGFTLALNMCALLIIYFISSDIYVRNKNISTIAGLIEAKTAENLEERSLRSILTNTQDDRERIDSYVLSDDKVVEFLETIESLGPMSSTKVVTSSVNIDESNKAHSSTTGFLNMQINVRGSWENVMHFISLIENLPYKITIKKVSATVITPDAETDIKLPEWQTNLEISVLKLKK